jgi:hypothetical protein
MTQQPPVYLDDNGEPVAPPVYLDEQGNPAGASAAPTPHMGAHARVGRMVIDNLPSVGGMLGGLAGAAGGPVVAAGTAALGGAAGRLGQRAISGLQRRSDAVSDLGEMAGDAAKAGAKEGAITAVGGAVGAGLAGGARRLYQGLAKPSKALRQEFPDLIPTALKERIPLTQGGARKIEGLVARSADQADNVVAQAERAGASPIQAREVIKEFQPVVEKLRKRVDIGQPSELAAVGERGRRLMRRPAPQLTRAQALKREAQEQAQAAYKARDLGNKTVLSADDLLNEATAKGLRKGVESRAPQVGPINAQTQARLGVDRMVSDAVSREGNTLAINGLRDVAAIGGGAGLGSLAGAPGAGAVGGLLLKLLSTPSTGSRAAILANDAARLGIPEHVLRALMVSARAGAPGEAR